VEHLGQKLGPPPRLGEVTGAGQPFDVGHLRPQTEVDTHEPQNRSWQVDREHAGMVAPGPCGRLEPDMKAPTDLGADRLDRREEPRPDGGGEFAEAPADGGLSPPG
jgi:hypothetical protein